jgi:hypothetical protein
MEPTPYQRLHWRIFNVMGRLMGWGFLVGGICGGLSFIPVLADGGVYGEPNIPRSEAIICIGMFFIFACLGGLLLKAKKYYPSDLREWFETEERRKMGTQQSPSCDSSTRTTRVSEPHEE